MEEDLLGDLIEYRKSKDKGVVTASRGLLQLFREVNPGMLKKRERVSEGCALMKWVADGSREKRLLWENRLDRSQRMVTSMRLSRVSKV